MTDGGRRLVTPMGVVAGGAGGGSSGGEGGLPDAGRDHICILHVYIVAYTRIPCTKVPGPQGRAKVLRCIASTGNDVASW